MKAMSTSPPRWLQGWAAITRRIRACTTPPPRSMAPVPAAPAWLERTWTMWLQGPTDPAASTALKLTAGDLYTCEGTDGCTAGPPLEGRTGWRSENLIKHSQVLGRQEERWLFYCKNKLKLVNSERTDVALWHLSECTSAGSAVALIVLMVFVPQALWLWRLLVRPSVFL